jgi:hypothetical protein
MGVCANKSGLLCVCNVNTLQNVIPAVICKLGWWLTTRTGMAKLWKRKYGHEM